MAEASPAQSAHGPWTDGHKPQAPIAHATDSASIADSRSTSVAARKRRTSRDTKASGGSKPDDRQSASNAVGAGRETATAMVQVRGHDYAIHGRYASQRLRLCEIVTAPKFDGAIAIIVVLNSVMIGLDLSFQVEGLDESSPQRLMVFYSDHVFLIVYTAELALRLFALGSSCLRDRWVQFDAVLVVSGILTNWIIEPIYAGAEMSNMTALRVARLLRVARAVRLLAQLKDLLILVRGLVDTASIICNALLLLFILLYIFGCAGVEFITKHELNIGDNPDPIFSQIVEEHFSSLMMTMLTLAQFVCLDSVASVYRPLVRLDGFLVIYFMICVVFLGIVLMNLITAVTVNGAIAMAAKDKATLCYENEESGNRFEKDLMSMFYRLDKDQSHTVSRDELVDLSDEDKTVMYGPNVVGNLWDIFDALDADGNGELTMDEFCSGIREVAYSHAPVEFKRIDKHLRLLHDEIVDLKDTISACLRVNGPSASHEQVNRLPQQVEHTNEPSLLLPLNERLHCQGPTQSCNSSIFDELRAMVATAVDETLRKVMQEGHGTSTNATNSAEQHLSKFPPVPAKSIAMPPIDSLAPPLDADPRMNGRTQVGKTESADPMKTRFSSADLRPAGDPPLSLARPDAPLPARRGHLQL